ncbi:MAG TPA: hypothetical protein VMV37_08480 [Gammaproteobacteria bacterium]|nr:hypothetical protein [Gammaproteobacteria bacterium]
MDHNWVWVAIPITGILAGVLTTWIRAKHGYPLDRRGRRGDWPQSGEIAELKAAVASRDALIEKLEERVRVLERIATDKPASLRDEIDRLRT